jgi:hypothetical protein
MPSPAGYLADTLPAPAGGVAPLAAGRRLAWDRGQVYREPQKGASNSPEIAM